MTGGDIAGLIAAGVFAVLVGLLAVPLIKLGRVFDETSAAIRDLNDNVTPLLGETTKQLARVDTITSSVEETTSNVSALVALFAATVGGPLIKIAGFSAGIRAAVLGLRQVQKTTSAKK